MTPLVGRGRELSLLEALIGGTAKGGGSLVLTGEAGAGKSALLTAASSAARSRGMKILAAAGVQSESRLPFAGLHQLLRPVLAGADELPARQRTALLSAFGMADQDATELFLTALAALDLLADVAVSSPLLLIAEDAQWLDRPTCDVLAFIARRIEAEPIALLAAVREGHDSQLTQGGLPELRVSGLDDDAAGALLDAHASNLAASVRKRLLAEAAGNPLALIELHASLGSGQAGGSTPLPSQLPLSTRLEEAFAARAAELPAATRTLLLIAAADESGTLAEVASAAAVVRGEDVSVEAIQPAVSARLIEADATELRFRHPLVRSAVYQAASLADRQAAHGALARVLAGQPDRSAWHRAAGITGYDEEVATELETAAARAVQRGAVSVAVTALERAAQLSSEPSRRARRLLHAAELAVELGLREDAARLLHAAEHLSLTSHDLGRMAWIREMADPGVPGDPARMRSLAEAAVQMSAEGDTGLALNLLWAAAMGGFWADRGRAASSQIVTAAEQLPVDDDDPRVLSILAYAAPIERAAVIIDRVSRHSPNSSDPEAMGLLGNAAATVGAFDLAEPFVTAAAAGLREQGRLAALAQVLVLRAWAEIHLARWDVARSDAEEAARLALETGQPIWAAGARAGQAILAGLRGEQEAAEALSTQAEQAGLTLGARSVLCVTQLARGLTALSSGRHADAYGHLRRMFDSSDPAYHHMESCWAIGNLAEAAVRSGNRDDARGVVARLEPLAAQTPSPWFHVAMRHARPLLADDQDAEALFRAGLNADLTRWPLDRARLLLAYGAWLRRQRRVAEARVPLRTARDSFDALGVVSFGERARQELRASGETSRRRVPQARDQLSPQQLQILKMAAEGLSNREIGQKLYLSDRTVGAHLYRAFPKLGITSRSQLGTVLQ
jgi:DNA-binding CsgD family transcriptional regulator